MNCCFKDSSLLKAGALWVLVSLIIMAHYPLWTNMGKRTGFGFGDFSSNSTPVNGQSTERQLKDTRLHETHEWQSLNSLYSYYENISRGALEEETCRNNVFFLKESKVGGTTLSTVLFKLALKFGAYITTYDNILHAKKKAPPKVTVKTFATIVRAENDSNQGAKDDLDAMKNFRLFHVDHPKEKRRKFAYDDAQSLFNRSTSLYITSYREPIARFKSLMEWNGAKVSLIRARISRLAMNCPYINGCGTFMDTFPCKLETPGCFKGKYTVFNKTRALENIRKFDIVIPTDELDLGIVLLSELLCFPLNEMGSVRMKELKTKSYEYSPKEILTLQQALSAEIQYYTLVKEEFQAIVRKKLSGEIEEYKSILSAANNKTTNLCGYSSVSPSKDPFAPIRRVWGKRSGFHLDVSGILKNDLKLLECLPLVIGPVNGVQDNLYRFFHESIDPKSRTLDRKMYLYKAKDEFRTRFKQITLFH